MFILKPKSFKNLQEMAKEADLFAEACGGVYTCVNKAQRDNKGGSRHKSDSKPSRKPEIKCSICGKGHLTIKCNKNPDRKQAYSAEVGVGASGYGGSKGSNSVPNEEAQGMQSKSRKENPQKLTQLISRSHPRHLVAKRTAQKDITIDTTKRQPGEQQFPKQMVTG